MSEKRFEVIAKEILELRKEMREEFRQYRIDAQAEFNLHRTVMQGALEQLQLNQRAIRILMEDFQQRRATP